MQTQITNKPETSSDVEQLRAALATKNGTAKPERKRAFKVIIEREERDYPLLAEDYDGFPRDAYVDIEVVGAREIYAHYAPDPTGTSIPSRVVDGLHQRFHLSPLFPADDLRALLKSDEVQVLAQRIRAGADYDGSCVELDDEAEEAAEKLQAMLDAAERECVPAEPYICLNASAVLDGVSFDRDLDTMWAADISAEEAAAEGVCALEDAVYAIVTVSHEKVADALRNELRRAIARGYDPVGTHRAAAIENGWIEENGD